MKKTIVIAGATVLLICSAAYGWIEYQRHNELEVVSAHVREVSALVGRQLAMDRSETVTYGEYIKRSDSSLEILDTSMLVFGSQKLSRVQPAAEAAVEFSTDAQELIRAASSQAKSRLQANVSEGLADGAQKEFESSKNRYVISSALERASKARKEQIAALDEAIKGEKAVKLQLSRLYSSDYKVKSELGQKEGLSPDTLKALSAVSKR
ncbi:Uncharacterized protein ALO87_03926 [Pseudomonas syringae pv. apii]|uniref:hypothetical protein n=1 Tax=Pseudomonas syringae group genomosp. 3 TaxID=251701 RepID=UPI0006E53891|nr:hypothetical protein [Pseudomonas syringae group genomosp. 3]KPW32515.1 Uncharacterized protein ALO87_03926 [Pseudomonas syringae pv. apii]